MSDTLTKRTTPATETVSHRGTLQWARIVCLSAFGPYVTGNARAEYIVVFASLAVILVTGWQWVLNAPFGPGPFLMAWGGLSAVILTATAWRAFAPGFYGSQPASHVLATYLMPPAF